MNLKMKLLFALLLFIQLRFTAQILPIYSVTVSSPQSTGYYFTTPIKIGAGTATVIPTQMILDNFGSGLLLMNIAGDAHRFDQPDIKFPSQQTSRNHATAGYRHDTLERAFVSKLIR